MKNWAVFYDLFSKNGNGDSIRPIAEELRCRCPETKFFFVSKTKRSIDMADEVIPKRGLRTWWVLRNAKYIISPMGFPNVKKRKGQVFVQTWHGTPLKKLYLSREPKNQKFKKDIKQYEKADIFCASCEFCREAFCEALNLKEAQFLNSGLPRNDILFTDHKPDLNLPQGKKVLFYCPTWRRYDYKMPLPLDLPKLKEKFGSEYVLLLRSHVGKHDWVGVNGEKIDIRDGEFCFNVADYPNISELYQVADILIGDYSSSIFDFAITGKPQIFYAYDLEDYKKEFGLYFDYNEFAPGPIARTHDELIAAIENIGDFEKNYGGKYKEFRKTFCTYEKGTAAKQVVEEMLKR